MARHYTVVVERDPESGWLVAEVLELPGCYTQAPDLATLEANVREAITVYLEAENADGSVEEFVVAIRDPRAPECAVTARRALKMNERRTATRRQGSEFGPARPRQRYRTGKAKKITTTADLAARLDSLPPMSPEVAAIFEETLRWCRGEGEFDDEGTDSAPPL